MTALGPDVTTSCGQYGRVLTVGSQYLVGIGGPCNHFGDWSEISSYTESELAYLQTLREDPTCDDDSGTSSNLSTGAIVGIVIGAIVGIVIGAIVAVILVAAVIGVIVLVCCWVCKKARHKGTAADVSKYVKHDNDDELLT